MQNIALLGVGLRGHTPAGDVGVTFNLLKMFTFDKFYIDIIKPLVPQTIRDEEGSIEFQIILS